jgi:hypothetical protein
MMSNGPVRNTVLIAIYHQESHLPEWLRPPPTPLRQRSVSSQCGVYRERGKPLVTRGAAL